MDRALVPSIGRGLRRDQFGDADQTVGDQVEQEIGSNGGERDEGSDADDRVVNVLRKLVADGLADFHVGFADEIVGGCKPGQVGHSLQVPDDEAWFHASRSVTQRPGVKKDVP